MPLLPARQPVGFSPACQSSGIYKSGSHKQLSLGWLKYSIADGAFYNAEQGQILV